MFTSSWGRKLYQDVQTGSGTAVCMKVYKPNFTRHKRKPPQMFKVEGKGRDLAQPRLWWRSKFFHEVLVWETVIRFFKGIASNSLIHMMNLGKMRSVSNMNFQSAAGCVCLIQDIYVKKDLHHQVKEYSWVLHRRFFYKDIGKMNLM